MSIVIFTLEPLWPYILDINYLMPEDGAKWNCIPYLTITIILKKKILDSHLIQLKTDI